MLMQTPFVQKNNCRKAWSNNYWGFALIWIDISDNPLSPPLPAHRPCSTRRANELPGISAPSHSPLPPPYLPHPTSSQSLYSSCPSLPSSSLTPTPPYLSPLSASLHPGEQTLLCSTLVPLSLIHVSRSPGPKERGPTES